MWPINVIILVAFLSQTEEAYACRQKRRNLNRDLTSENEANKSRPSLSTIMFGETGCELLCNILSQFYGCEVRPISRKMIYCDCNETFLVNGERIPMEKFKTLQFNSLWDYWFEKSPESTNLRDRIQRNGKMNAFVLPLLRNPYLTANEIKQSIMDEYPNLRQIERIRTIVHGNKEDITKSTSEVNYDNLGNIFPNLFNNARSRVVGSPYQTRLNNLLNKLSKDELEQVKNEIQKTGKKYLEQVVTDYMNDNVLDSADGRFPRRGGKRALRRLLRNSSDEKKPKTEDSESDLNAYERKMIEIEIVKDLMDAADRVQRWPNESTMSAGGRINSLYTPTAKTAVNIPQNISNFSTDPITGKLGNTILKNTQDNVKKQIEQYGPKKQMRKGSEPLDETGAHTKFDFNSVSNRVVTTVVDGEQTRLEDAGVKKIHEDSDRPEDNMNKEFELNAVSLKNNAKNVDNKVMQTLDMDNIKGRAKIQERVQNGDEAFVMYHDTDGETATSGQQLNSENFDILKGPKSSKYYLVFDEEGNIVHAINS